MDLLTLNGYHGTSAERASVILSSGFIDSSGTGSWFGLGVYFFQTYHALCDGHSEALQWAQNVKRYSDPVVIKAIISSGDYIDLLEDAEQKEAYQKLVNKAKEKLSTYKRQRIDETKIFGMLYKGADVDFVRVLTSGHRACVEGCVYANARPQVQICVKKQSCMSGCVLA